MNQPVTSTEVKSLGEQINEEHEATKDSVRYALRHAMACGALLMIAQENAKATGKSWLGWLKENTEVKQTIANLYMRFAEHKDTISNAVANSSEPITFRDAIKLLPKKAARGGVKGKAKSTSKPTQPLDVRDPNVASDEIVLGAMEAGRDLVEMGKKVIDGLDTEPALDELASYLAIKLKKVKGIE